jgi:hypothetical protein
MNISEDQIQNLILELETLEIRVQSKIKRLKDEMGLSKKYRFRIQNGRIIQGKIRACHQYLKAGHLEKGLDGVFDLVQKKIKIHAVSFPPDHKTFLQIQKESILKNPEQLIKRSKSHGGGYRK